MSEGYMAYESTQHRLSYEIPQTHETHGSCRWTYSVDDTQEKYM